VLGRALTKLKHFSKETPGSHDRIEGVGLVNKTIRVDQSPIGATPASTPATYTGVYDLIRNLFSSLPESQKRGLRPGSFSFNVEGGRCPVCEGAGQRRIEMHFLPDVWVSCEACSGLRFSSEILDVTYRGKSIGDVLRMTCDEAHDLFNDQPRIAKILQLLRDVGLGYLPLGQSANTLSGGEAQRVKLASELARPDTGSTLYLLDEPTTGLHFDDVRKLLDVLHRLVDLGNTVLVIEHNLDVIKCADWVIDMGPEAGENGGRVVAAGPPEAIVKSKQSLTGKFLKPVLESSPVAERPVYLPQDEPQKPKPGRQPASSSTNVDEDVEMDLKSLMSNMDNFLAQIRAQYGTKSKPDKDEKKRKKNRWIDGDF
jgi:excinuclease ABC subunit A